jgi:hypothetical protein
MLVGLGSTNLRLLSNKALLLCFFGFQFHVVMINNKQTNDGKQNWEGRKTACIFRFFSSHSSCGLLSKIVVNKEWVVCSWRVILK